MRLKSVKLTNFRGYQTTTAIPIDEAMTGIVGRNGYGKSTSLEGGHHRFKRQRQEGVLPGRLQRSGLRNGRLFSPPMPEEAGTATMPLKRSLRVNYLEAN
ncbi:MAG: AAA family ATPase [Pseudomonas sp.]